MSKTASNPFFRSDFTKFMDMSRITEMPKGLQDFKMPGLDFDAFMAAQRKNLQAIAQASQTAVEGVQAVLRRQSDILRQGMEESTQMFNQVVSSSTPEEKVTKQTEIAKCVFDRVVGNVKEMTEMLTKVNYETLDVIRNRLGEGLEEMRGMVKNAGTGSDKEGKE